MSVGDIKASVGQGYATQPNGGPISNEMAITGNNAFVLRALNERTGKQGGLMVWSNSTTAFGAWNPREFSTEGDWMPGDRIKLIDYNFESNGTRVAVATNCTYSVTNGTTGWNLAADSIRFGQSGLVGGYWTEMGIGYELGDAL